MAELKDLVIEEVSFVNAGANPFAYITLCKRKGEKNMTNEEQGQQNFSDLTAELSKLTTTLRKQIEKAEDVEWLKVASKYELLGQDAKKLAPMLKKAKAEAPEVYELAIQTLDSALEAVNKSQLFEEIGKSGTRSEINQETQIEKFAAELRAKDSTLSYRKSIDEAFLAHPELKF